VGSFDGLEKRFSPYGVPIDLGRSPKILYHYTDSAGLLGMLQHNVIWTTEYRFLNDRSEIDHTQSMVREILDDRIAKNSDGDLSRFYARALHELSTPRDTEQVFFFSLSEERDSLSQWRGYARDGCGFTLGFDLHVLANTAEDDAGVFGICRVEYDHDVQRRGMEAALDAIEKRLVTLIKGKTAAQIGALIVEAARSFEVIVWNRAVSNKHSSFESEKEWRLFYFTAKESLPHVKVRSRGLALVPYVEFTAAELGGEDGKLPVVEVGIGPGFSDRSQALPVVSLCRQTGYDMDHYFASAPYRSG
jgi:hypothetical protein